MDSASVFEINDDSNRPNGWYYWIVSKGGEKGPFPSCAEAVTACRLAVAVKKMLTAADLSREELERIVTAAQQALWLESTDGDRQGWDPDTQWSWERIEQIAEVMIDLGLRPAEAFVS